MLPGYEVREVKYDQWDVDNAFKQGTQHGITLGIFYGVLGVMATILVAGLYQMFFAI